MIGLLALYFSIYFVFVVPNHNQKARANQLSDSENTESDIFEDEEGLICQHEYSVQSFFERLLDNYDKNLLPNEEGNVVELEVHIQEISEISESRSDFTVDMFISEIWYDPRLTFDSLEVCRSNITMKTEYKSKIWTPDTCVINSKQAVLHKSPSDNAFFIIYSNGKIWQNHRMHIRGPCEINLRAFPFDTQTCSVSFETNSYNSQEVELKWFPHPVTLLWQGQLPDFHLMSTLIQKSRMEYPNGLWDQLQLTFVFKRKVGYYLFQAYFPTALTVVVSWLTFYLESKALSARVTLSVSALLALTFQFGNVLNHLPRVSYVKYIDVWMIACCVFVFASMVEMAATCQCTRRQTRLKVGKRGGPVDTRWMEINICPIFLGPLTARLVGKTELEGGSSKALFDHPTTSTAEKIRGSQRFFKALRHGSWIPWRKTTKRDLSDLQTEEQFMAIHNKVTDEVIIMGVEEDQPAQIASLSEGQPSQGLTSDKLARPRGSVMVQYMPSMDPALKRNIHFNSEIPSPKERPLLDTVLWRRALRRVRELADTWSKYRMTADRLDRISRVMFPVGFFLFNLLYWTAYYLSLP